MAYITADRIRESTEVVGSDVIVLLGAANSFLPFSSAMAIGDRCTYTIVARVGNDWESGIATYSAVGTLTRTQVRKSSNNNQRVAFTAGAKDVFMGPTSWNMPAFDPITNAITGANWGGSPIPVTSGGTGATAASEARANLGLVIGTDVLAPNGSAASLTNFPTLNQNTTGTAANVTGIVAVANGGTGVTASTGTGSVVLSNSPTLTSPNFPGDLTCNSIYPADVRAGGNAATATWKASLNAMGTGDLILASSGSVGFASVAGPADLRNSIDTMLLRDSANALAQRFGSTAQSFRVYNSFSDSANYERFGITWEGNICTLGLAQAGTGATRSLMVTGANATTGAGGNVTIAAGNGSGVGAGGNIILQPGAQGSSGGNGWVKFYDVTGANTRMGAWNNSTQGYGFGWDTQNNGTLGTGLVSSSVNGTGYIGVKSQTSNHFMIETNNGITALLTNSANTQSRLIFVNGNNAQTTSGSAGICSYTTGVITIRDGGTSIAGGSFSFPSSTTAFSANTNDLALIASAFQRINCTSAASLTGIAPPSGGTHADGRMIRIYNVGTTNLTLAHNSASSTAANRMFSSTGADIVIVPNQSCELIYDSTNNGSGAAGWRVSAAR